jgi:hypothetical protein
VSTARPEEIDDAFRPRRAPATHTVEIDGEAIVLDEASNRLHLLNASGALVWACCDGSGTLREIGADLAANVGIPVDQVTNDVVAMARALGIEGLLDGVDGHPGETGVAVPDVQVSAPPA